MAIQLKRYQYKAQDGCHNCIQHCEDSDYDMDTTYLCRAVAIRGSKKASYAVVEPWGKCRLWVKEADRVSNSGEVAE
jgi:hypothetical protein